MRDQEQARLTDDAYSRRSGWSRSTAPHSTGWRTHCSRRRRSSATRCRRSSPTSQPESSASETVGRVVPIRARSRRGGRPRTVRSLACSAKRIHHLGVAVEDLDDAVDTYRRLFGAEVEHRETMSSQGVEAAAVRVGESRVELLASLGEETPVGKFLANRGPGMHHVAYEVSDLRRELKGLAEQGVELDRRGAAPGALRARGRLRPPGRRPRSPRGAGGKWLRTASGSRSASTAAR